MKILVLNNDPGERNVIQQVLGRAGHAMLPAADSQAAWALLEAGQSRFIIADRATTDIDEKQFISRVRSHRFPAQIYILLILPKSQELDHSGVDDHLYKPLTAAELKSRIAIGERILGLGDNLSQARDQLENLALLDEHTGLLNQKAFLASARGELERARRVQSPLSLMALDIRDFGSLTDAHGLEAGENVLSLIAQVIREKSRPYDCIGRWSEDQFVSALPGVIGADAEKIAERIMNGIRSLEIITEKGSILRIEMGAGIAAAARIGASTGIEELIEQAIQALVRSNESGGNQIYLTYV